MASTITAWLFDLYPSLHGLTFWLVDKEGRQHCCFREYAPAFYMHLSTAEKRHLEALVPSLPCKVTLDHHIQKEIYRNEEWDVVRVNVHDTLQLKSVVRQLERLFPHYVFFNSDILVPQLFLYSTGLFPLAFGEYHIDENNRLVGWDVDDKFDAEEYTLPPLTTMKLANKPDFVSPKHRKVYQLEVSYDGQTYSLEDRDPADVLNALNRHLQRCDPDIILTEYGDAILLPMLARLAAEHQVPLALNRDQTAGYFTTHESSYFVYGKIVHKDGAFELAGRWHLDIENSFMMGEASLDGVVEIARLTQLPIQHQSRSSIGTSLSSMQLSWAIRNNYLIPAKKREPEDFKSAATLLLADRGGLIFQPKLGYHEQVAELDFVSMYPTIMVEHNVSPETVNCRCCTKEEGKETVPELEYTICGKRTGIIPSTLRTVVKKRAHYKKEKKRLKKLGDPNWEKYDHRQNALKWMLVTCFGYLGYKNARFGRIEAHESVNAYSRDAILKAKEMAEEKGYEFIHAIVDCMWIKKEGATEADYEQLAAEISKTTGIDLSLEGIYNWILFPASKMDPHIPTANRYVGYYSDEEIKIRGIEVRRRDTPKFIKRMQVEMLKVLEHAKGVKDVEMLVSQMLEKAKEFIDLLRSGKADPLELVIRRHISQEANEYKNRSASAEVTKALDEAGITLAPGESIEYILVDATGKKKPQKAIPLSLYSFDEGYDIEKYTEMSLKAAETLLFPFGYDVERLGEVLVGEAKRKRKTRVPIARTLTSAGEIVRLVSLVFPAFTQSSS
ncbi:MAG: polB [Bacteroidetes bacterium]|nr:polB [Bacteroidota bacterium]